MRTVGGVVNTTVIVAAAEGIVSAQDVTNSGVTYTSRRPVETDGIRQEEVLQCREDSHRVL